MVSINGGLIDICHTSSIQNHPDYELYLVNGLYVGKYATHTQTQFILTLEEQNKCVTFVWIVIVQALLGLLIRM